MCLSAVFPVTRANLWARVDHAGRTKPRLNCPVAAFSTIHSAYYGHWPEIQSDIGNNNTTTPHAIATSAMTSPAAPDVAAPNNRLRSERGARPATPARQKESEHGP